MIWLARLSLLLTDTPLGVAALIGMLMLVGIVVTNAIVLIDPVNQYRRSGCGLLASRCADKPCSSLQHR